ncbi:exodeoxyribonuclease V subunit alpha [Lysobacter sp. GX 14042]|uniref:exodeoxyribonuclease V subunit alpha n=1 Tax=Lysobacter sp. GX 14042 TaxID=2907155 RepID=UPI001F18C3D8|nr:exodeoxyribonuclease V subunit alpha [Lysobacter sp. GX 14042]MCE7032309.1 exodeoxyribonuclease V subunit alpha [Lysobacter sp. GX 14042]
MSLLDVLQRGGHLRPLDSALAASLSRLRPGTDPLVAAAAALASLAVARGHAAFDPARPGLLVTEELDWPSPQAWAQALGNSPWVATPAAGAGEAHPGDALPLPLAYEDGLVYLRRYREYERRLATRLAGLASAMLPAPPEAVLAPVLETLFPAAGSDPLQALAARSALDRALLLVTGGPGTGKTTTIARLLVLLVAAAVLEGREPPRIALAAPTGRAAERMAGSLRSALEYLRAMPGIEPGWLDALPDGAGTVHRLLGARPGSIAFRHDPDHPLPFDVVVVDEASMVDLPLMCKLVEAVPKGGRLVLLGDPDQLPSVEAGDVLAAICDASGDPAGNQTRGSVRPPLHGHRVHLRRAYRQVESLDLAPLSEAVRAGDGDRVVELLRAATLQGVSFHEDALDPLAVEGGALTGHWRHLAGIGDPASALAAADRVRLLVAMRHGPQGTRALNVRIEQALAGPRAPTHFHGRLLLVTENSYRHRLFNGDVGVCLRDGGGHVVAWFPGSDAAAPRAFHPAALPAHESAFAMTVHKAQGSEFDQVWLQLPAADNRVLSRELLYTAVTRTRRRLHVCASAAVLRAALGREVVRVSGLAGRLNG